MHIEARTSVNPTCEILVSTYENSRALDLCLTGLSKQIGADFRLCVADDGSSDETREVVERWRRVFGEGRLRHVWQPHRGFGKNAILNQAIRTSAADYLIFIDGDCVASPGFVRRHFELRGPGRFLTGGVVRLTAAASALLATDLVRSGEVFTFAWLRAQGSLGFSRNWLKVGLLPRSFLDVLEVLSPVSRTWNGGNSSGWRQDLLAVNGFNEAMCYGAEDIELGVRLNNFGVRGRHLRYTATLLHVDHVRGYADPRVAAENRRKVEGLRHTDRYWAEDGIRKGGP